MTALRAEVLDAPAGDFALTVLGDRVVVVCTADRPVEAAIRMSVAIEADDPSFLIPGAFYGQNRPEGNDRVFPRYQPGASDPRQHAVMVSDEWHLRADRCATPIVFCWAGQGEPGIALRTTETGPLGPQSVGFAFRDGVATLSVTAPAREHPIGYYGDDRPRPPLTGRHRFTPGERVELVVSVHALSADRHDYDRVLRGLHDAVAPTPWTDAESAAAVAAEGLLRWHYDPEPGVLLETAGFDREVTGRDGLSVDRQAMHVGWISGIPWATALLQYADRIGDGPAARAARRVIDTCTAQLSPSGTFWGVWYRGSGWTQSWTTRPRGLHGRTLGEATDFLLRALQVHDDPGWRTAAVSNLDATVGRQRPDGALPGIHHADTGEVLSWSGSASLAWVPALLRASALDDRYRPAAERAGHYYARFVEAEHLHGAPEDVDLAPTSEDGYVAVMAYAALHRATGAPRWLDLARRAAEWTFTFRYSYDVDFPPLTPLQTWGFRTTGADQASSSNQHLHAYGLICTGDLLDLTDWTGDGWYRRRAMETVACFRQLLPMVDGQLNAYRGMITERYYQTDCFQPKGMMLTLSHAWSAGVLLLASEELIARGEG